MTTSQCVYVFGADGMLGRALVAACKRADCAYVGIGRSADVTRRGVVDHQLADAGGFDVIINAAGFTNVDACELDAGQAFAVNAWGARNVAAAAEEADLRLIHISTGAVFDGLEPTYHDRDGFDEFVPPKPISAYARSKWAGEELVRQHASESLIVRLGHLYGPGGKNGLSTARARLLAGETVTMNDQHRIGPTYVVDAARVILGLAMERHIFGTVHLAPDGRTTAFQFGSRLRDALPGPGTGTAQVFGDTIVYPVTQSIGTPGKRILGVSGPVLAENVAWRSSFQVMRSRLLNGGLSPIGTWEEGLDRYIRDEASL